jgi:cytochrome c
MKPTPRNLYFIIFSFFISGAHADTPVALTELLKKNSCTACHSIEKKIIGPSFKDVAAKYGGDKSAETKLAAKIKSGGGGVWGSMPMPPQAAKDDDIRAIVKQLLELK